jgi:hypothetical protein
MKKLLYLLFVLSILGCSTNDDSSDDLNTEKTFLEEYNNTVFECQNCPGNIDYSSPLYIGFTPSDNFLYYNYNLTYCYYIFEGNLNGLNDDFGIVAITNNTIDNLTYTKTYGNGVEVYNFNTSGGTSLNLTINRPDAENSSFLYILTDLAVGDICN